MPDNPAEGVTTMASRSKTTAVPAALTTTAATPTRILPGVPAALEKRFATSAIRATITVGHPEYQGVDVDVDVAKGPGSLSATVSADGTTFGTIMVAEVSFVNSRGENCAIRRPAFVQSAEHKQAARAAFANNLTPLGRPKPMNDLSLRIFEWVLRGQRPEPGITNHNATAATEKTAAE